MSAEVIVVDLGIAAISPVDSPERLGTRHGGRTTDMHARKGMRTHRG
jgi:hypothetical protein